MLVNVERAQRLMEEEGLDGLVATTAPNVYYLSGLWSRSLFMWPGEAQVYAVAAGDRLSQRAVVASTGDMDTALECFPGVEIINYGPFNRYVAEGVQLTPEETRLKELAIDRHPRGDALEGLVAALEETGLTAGVIGLDERGINASYPGELTNRLPKLEIRPASSLLTRIRMVKTPEEIKRLREAVRVTEKAILRAVGIAREGVTEGDLAREFDRALIDQGAEPLFTGLRVGRQSAFGQVRAGETPLRRGDRIWFDVGCRYQGYSSDIARTFAFGDIGERARRFYDAIFEGEEAGLAAIKAGVRADEVFRVTVDAVRKAGIPNFRRRMVGHGMGIWLYDPPMLAPGDETILEEGMVLDIEPPYYELGTGALAVEDTLVVTSGRPELLTSISRKLEDVG